MRILLTGYQGSVGRFLLRHLQGAGHDVVVTSRQPVTEEQELRVLEGDLATASLDLRGFDAVVHAAGTATASGASADKIISDNVMATHALYNAARRDGVGIFVYLSTMSVYGKVAARAVDEETLIVSPNIYGASKYLTELLLENGDDSMRKLVLRLPAILCPGVWGHWLSRTLDLARKGENIVAYNPESQFNNVVDADDLGAPLVSLLGHDLPDFSRLVLGSREILKIRDVVDILLDGTGSTSSMTFAVAGDSFVIDPTLAVTRYGFSPRPLAVALKRYAENDYGD